MLYDYTIYCFIKRCAKIYSDLIAIISNEKKITYGELKQKTDKLANGLLNLGIEKGDRIGVLAENCLEYVCLYCASAKIGAIIVPINYRLKEEEMEYIVSDSMPKFIFAGKEFQDMVGNWSKKFDFIKACYGWDGIEKGCEDFYILFIDKSERMQPKISVDEPFAILYTAAVSGKPRGAVLSQKNIIANNVQTIYHFKLAKDDCNLGILPLYHVFGLVTLFSVMHTGGATVLIPHFDAEVCLKLIQKHKVTFFAEFPPILSKLLEKYNPETYDLSSLKAICGLDRPETIKLLEEKTKAAFWTVYGQTEGGIVTCAPYSEKAGSAGVPEILSEVAIVDGYDNVVAEGKSGEIVVRGPTVFKGYWKLDEVNRLTFRNEWHHTGDMGKFDTSGYLFYVGRKPEKELIKTGGENVYPAEVEGVIMEHPNIKEVCVIGVSDKQWGEAVKAICVLEGGVSLQERELSEFVASKIARYKRPKYIEFVSELPKTKEGLIDRGKVKSTYGGFY